MKFNNVIIAAALLVATAGNALAAEAAPAKPVLTRTQEYRLWSAEEMIKRLNGFSPELAGSIRRIAAGGDDVQWAEIIDIVRALEVNPARATFKKWIEQDEVEKEQARLKFERERARQSLDNFYFRHPDQR